MTCTVCQEPYPSSLKFVYDKGESLCLGCDRCLGIQPTVHDVYFKHAYKSEALDVEFTSKAQKAQYLKDHHLTEAGDYQFGQKTWIEGSRDYRKKNFEKDRPMIRETLKRYRDNARRK